MKKIIFTIICCLFLCGCDNNTEINDNSNNQNNSDNVQHQTESSNSTQQSNKEKQKYKIGDDLIVTTSDGEYRIKFTGVKETSDRNQYSDTQADRVIIVEYEYENISLEEDLYIFSSYFKLYDKDNNAMETYPAIGTKSPSNISVGRKTSASEAFALNNSNNYVELEYYHNMFDSKSIGTVVLEW